MVFCIYHGNNKQVYPKEHDIQAIYLFLDIGKVNQLVCNCNCLLELLLVLIRIGCGIQKHFQVVFFVVFRMILPPIKTF